MEKELDLHLHLIDQTCDYHSDTDGRRAAIESVSRFLPEFKGLR